MEPSHVLANLIYIAFVVGVILHAFDMNDE